MRKTNKFFYRAETDSYVVDKELPDNLCEPISAQDYFTALHTDLYVYDIEVYPNAFTITIIRPSDMGLWRFEISFRKHDGVNLFLFLEQLRACGARMVGFNNEGYDYPVLHVLVVNGGHVTNDQLYGKSQSIINTPFEERFGSIIWPDDQFVRQIDLFKIHHFDNISRATSLKMLENNMRSGSIEDLPYDPTEPLTEEQLDNLIIYNDYDVDQTIKFLYESIHLIEFRDELSEKYNKDFTNHNDTKIGKDFLIMELEKSGIECYHRENGRKKPRQTIRPVINLNEVVLPYINFHDDEFKRILNYFKQQSITETKGVFKDLNCTVNGFKYVFGTGGIHGSVNPCIIQSDENDVIIDLDVASYYPNLSITNNLYPEHLTTAYCPIYNSLYEMRKNFPKGTPENAMLKLALNGAFGDSNSKYSPFYDPNFTMSITINGQLLLCLLAEWLGSVPNLKMIQINTDGLTVKLPGTQVPSLEFIARSWEEFTGLTLESVNYNRMFIRDVNSYIGEYEDGSLKRKGVYCYGDDLDWNQNFSSQVVAKAACNFLITGQCIEDFIINHDDNDDFTLCVKAPRSSRLVLDVMDEGTTTLQNTCRYYVTREKVQSLKKIMPPTPKQLEKNPDAPERIIRINSGWNAKPCNNMDDFNREGVNYKFYVSEAKKIIEPLT